MGLRDIVSVRNLDGPSQTFGKRTITPRTQAVTLRLPFETVWFNSGFVWTRPTAVLVEQDGRRERVAIFNVTRLITFVVVGISLAVSLLLWSLWQLRRVVGAHGSQPAAYTSEPVSTGTR